MSIRIQTEDFDLSVELNRLRSDHRDIGAVVSFVGTVRDVNDDDGVLSMELEHYPGMTESALEEIESRARQRWDILDSIVIHRVGVLQTRSFWLPVHPAIVVKRSGHANI